MSNKLYDYLTKRTILDFHFRGEQDVFEEKYPHLKEKAIKMLGPILYYDLSEKNGQMLSEKSNLYKQLMHV